MWRRAGGTLLHARGRVAPSPDEEAEAPGPTAGEGQGFQPREALLRRPLSCLSQPSLGRVSKWPLPTTTRSPLILVQGHEGIQACQVPLSGGEDHSAGPHRAECPRRQASQGAGLPLPSRSPVTSGPDRPFLELHWVPQPAGPDHELPWEPAPSEAAPVHARPLRLWGWAAAVGARRVWP